MFVLKENTNLKLIPRLNLCIQQRKNRSDTGKGVLRYMAGRCIHVLHRHLTQRLKKCLYSERKRAILKELDAETCLVESLKVPYNKTSQPETLMEIERRQYLSHGLTHISDEFLNLILDLESERLSINNTKGLHTYGSNILQWSLNHISKDSSLIDQWKEILKENECCDKYKMMIWTQICECYLRVSNNTFRKEMLVKLERRQKKTHRTAILISKSITGTSATQIKFNIQMFTEDTAEGKINSHNLLKSLIEKDTQYLKHGKFYKLDLIKLCKCYTVSYTRSNTKDQLIAKITEAVMNPMMVPHPDALSTTTPASKSATGKRKLDETEQSVTEESGSSTLCPVCMKAYQQDEQWICCDHCDVWSHRLCSGLDDEQWAIFSVEDQTWKCNNCSSH